MWSDVPCKMWGGAISNPGGYGVRSVKGRPERVHRLAWAEVHGPIPDGMFVLHHCDNRACYEVEHLFLGDRKTSIQIMLDRGHHASQRKTHCPKGHEYTSENTRIYRNVRHCRQCDRERRAHPRTLPTHCINGHPFDEENTWVDPKTGWRQCRACGRERKRRSSTK